MVCMLVLDGSPQCVCLQHHFLCCDPNYLYLNKSLQQCNSTSVQVFVCDATRLSPLQLNLMCHCHCKRVWINQQPSSPLHTFFFLSPLFVNSGCNVKCCLHAQCIAYKSAYEIPTMQESPIYKISPVLTSKCKQAACGH